MENLKYTEILQLNKALTGTISTRPYTVSVLSNVTVNSFKDILEYFFRINKIEPIIELGNYDNIVQDSVSVSSKDMVIVFYDMLNIADSTGNYFEGIEDGLYDSLKKKIFTEIDIVFDNLKNVPLVVFNSFSSAFFVPAYAQNSKADMLANELNDYVIAKDQKNVTVINIDKIIVQIGVKQAVDLRFYHSSKAPYTIAFFKNYCLALQPVILRNTGKLRKAIIFDCDNTLWKGILGEDGFQGIDMSASSKQGQPYHVVQQMAKNLSRLGVLVGICSKNNPTDVEEVFNKHPDIVLKDEHIVIKKINWDDKVSNLRAIAEELNIGLDSLVFIDDSSFEVNLVKEQLPEVLTVQVPATGYAEMLQATIYGNFNLSINRDDVKKTEMYKQQFQREDAKRTHGSIDDYLASLEMEISISKDNADYIPRIAQLTQKTNQFNLTTKRYTESQVESFIKNEDSCIYTLSVTDKFGDNGLTGVCILVQDKNDATTTTIDSLLMSCRVIGRNIEIVFLNFILEALKDKGCETVKASFAATKKNEQVEQFYEKMGFTLLTCDDQTKEYALQLKDHSPKEIGYIKIKEEINQNQ